MKTSLAALTLVLWACVPTSPYRKDADGGLTPDGGGALTERCQGLVQSDAGMPSEACNGLDDDCDGRTDEDFSLFGPCDSACPNGVAFRGRRVCGNDGVPVCEPNAGWQVCH